MPHDERITEYDVLSAIEADQTHTIWSPCTTLSRMGIERFPFLPNTNRLAMKSVLESLHDQGFLVKRKSLHSYFTYKEVAYEKVSK